MASKIKNTVDIEVRERGSAKAAKGMDQVGRAQTRMGQSAASTGRQFSAQASGLGGLVAAYAGAAANVFALQQAFAALQRAAQADTIVRGTKTLAIEIGESGKAILDNVREITQGQLTLAEAAGNVNIALSAGFDSSQIEKLTDISMKASRALGRSLTDAFTRVTRGAAKLEPELLDELGIFTRIDPAVEAYANKLNVATSSLTNYEKRQAFVNAVIEEGAKKFGNINTSAPSAQKSIERLTTTLVDLATEFGQMVAAILTPFLDFISNNMGNALLAFGGILALVFGKAMQLIGGFASKAVADLRLFADSLRLQSEKASGSLGKLTQAQNELNASIEKRGKGKLGTFTQKGIPAAIAQEAAAVRSRFRAGDVSQRDADRKFLQGLTRDYKLTGAAATDAKKMLQGFDAAAKSATLSARGLAGASLFLGKALKFVGTAASWIGRIFSGLFFIISIGQLAGTLFGFDFLGMLQDKFQDLSQSAENLKEGLLGATSAAAGGVDKLESSMKRLGMRDKELRNLSDTMKDLNKEVMAAREPTVPVGGTAGLANAAQLSGASLQAGTNINPLQSRFAQMIGGNVGMAQRAPVVGALQGQGVQTNVQQFQAAVGTQTGLEATLASVDKLIAAQDGATEKSRQTIEQLKYLRKAYEEVGHAAEYVGAVSRVTGITTDQVASTFKKYGEVLSSGAVKFNLLGITVDAAKKDFSELDKTTQDSLIALNLFGKTLKDANDTFDQGSANSETLSKKLGGLQKSYEKMVNIAEEDWEILPLEQLEAIAKANKEVEELNKKVRRLKALEGIGKALTDTFGSQIKALDTAVSKGMVNGFGQIAKSSGEVAANQARFLSAQIDTTRETEKGVTLGTLLEQRARGRVNFNSEENKLLENRDKTLKIIAGTVFKLTQELEKQIKGQEKLLVQLQGQYNILVKQTDLQRLQSALKTQQAEQQSLNDLKSEEAKIEQANINLAKSKIDSMKKIFNAQKDINNAIRAGLDLDRQIAALRAKQASSKALGAKDAQMAQAQGRMQEMDTFPGLFTHPEVREQKEKLVQLEFERAMLVIEERKRLAAEERDTQLQIAERKRQDLDDSLAHQVKLMAREEELFSQQQALQKIKNQEELHKLEQDKANLVSQKAIAQQEMEVGLAQIKAEEARNAFLAAQDAERLKGLEIQKNVVNAFIDATGPDTAFVTAIREFLKAEKNIDISKQLKDAPKIVEEQFTKLKGLMGQTGDLRDLATFEKKMGIIDKGAANESRIAGQITANEALQALVRRRHEIETDIENEKMNAAREERAANYHKTEIELSNIDKLITKITEKYNLDMEGATRAAEKAQQKRDQDMQNIDDQYNYTKQFGNDVSRIFSGELTGAFDNFFDSVAQGKGVLDSAKSAFNSFMQSIISSLQKKVTQKFIEPALESFFGSIFTSGGPVRHMAGGGMMRDRVPAMLEPGEFVIRKPMAKAIGGPALHAMNGTGKGLTPNIEVVVNNQGAPKDAQANVKPQIDVNKMVVEIVTSDLRNNGPIRKSLRAGGSS